MKIFSKGSRGRMRHFAIGGLMLLGPAILAAQERVPDIERNALISIFRETHGERWKDTTGWLSEKSGKQGAPGTECDWEGVSCDERKRHVTGLSLRNSELAGVIPSSIGDLSRLENLDLSFNHLQGRLPAQLFRLEHLTRLNLSENQLEGTLPSTLAGLAVIENLDLARNYLTGPIRPIGTLHTLVYLDLSDNRFDGPLPSSFGALHALVTLNLSRNYLMGRVPPQIGNMSSASQLGLAHNRFTGALPADLGRLKELQGLDVSYNDLHGTFPASMGKLQNLRFIDASHNALGGRFPASLCQAPLYELELSWNRLSGELPSEIAKCSDLAQLFLSHNNLEGKLPSAAMTSMESLKSLDLSDNAFSGNLANLRGTSFSLLHLDRNRFSGPIPPELFADSLRELTLSGNRLTGDLPVELCSLESLRVVDLSDNGLTGPMCGLDASSDALGRLAFLNLSHNRLSGPLPSGLFALARLTSVNLSHNLFTGPLPEIAALPCLQILDLSNNQLREAVRSLGKLPFLTSVNLSHNLFTSGLEELATAKSLRHADLRYNPWAQQVPPRLARIESAGVVAPALAITPEEARGRLPTIHIPPRPPLPHPQNSQFVMLPPTRAPTANGSSLAGSVIDSSGAVVAGARVSVKSPDATGPETATTDSEGRFQFIVPANDYEVIVESPGFLKAQQQVSIQDGNVYTLNVTLAVGATTETVAVSAEQPPTTRGPWWNTWIAKQGATETARETFLTPGRQYSLFLELSAIQTRDAARGETHKEINHDLRQKLLQLVKDGTPLQSLFVRISIIGRAIQLSRGVNSVQAWSPSSQQWAPSGDSASSGTLQTDLSRLFPDLAAGLNPSAPSGGRSGAIQFGMTAGKNPGCAAIAISIWDETRMIPLDQLVRMVSVGQKTDCAGQVIENPTATSLYSDTARGVKPDVSLHVFEFKLQGKPHSASFMVLHNSKGACKSYQWDSDATLSMQVLSGDEFTQDLDRAQNTGGSYAPVAKVLTNTVFAEADRINKCGAVAAFAALKQLAQTSDVQMFARVSDDQGTLNVVPLGLMAMHQEAGQNVFLHDIRLTQPVAQESLEDTSCVSDWTFLLPSDLDGFTPQQLELPSSLADAHVYRTLDDFHERFVNAPDDAGPSGLLLLAHHLSGTLTTSGNDKLSFGQINRDLGQGSIAILSACKTGNLSDDTGMIRSLNEHGVDAMVATAFELDEKFGKAFAFNFAQLVHSNTGPLTVGQAFKLALSKTASDLGGTGTAYTPEQARGMSLELVLAGNPNLQICRAKIVPPR